MTFQVLKGDLKSAIEMHEMLYQIIQRHNFLPEVSSNSELMRRIFKETSNVLSVLVGGKHGLKMALDW